MAVATKNREAASTRGLGRLQVDILAGVAYVLLALGIVFPLTDYVWWWRIGFPHGNAGYVVGFLAVECVLALGLLVLGRRLLKAHSVPGLRAGIALGTAGFLLLLLFVDWFGGWMADLAFTNNWPKAYGIVPTGILGIVLLVLGGRAFLGPQMASFLVALEEQGWFSTTSYKRSQGLRVRRGTILGILILVAVGVWVLHQGLNRQPGAALEVAAPFAGSVPVTWQSVGDDPALKQKLEERQQPLTAKWEKQRQEAVDTLRAYLPLPLDVRDRLRELERNNPRNQAVLEPLLRESAATPGGAAEQGLTREQEAAVDHAIAVLREPEPGAVVFVDRFALRDQNATFTSDYVKIASAGDDPYPNLTEKEGETFNSSDGTPVPADVRKNFAPGEVVPKRLFEEQVAYRTTKRQQLEEKRDNRVIPTLIVPPTKQDVVPAKTEPVEYAVPPGPLCPTRVILPAMAFTLPVLLGALGFWFAWRVVNVPAFGDFLIATEAELNKVSWMTRKRLWQDTVVVLTTVILLAVVLFIADVMWSKVLTGIGVLQPPPPPSEQQPEQPW